MRVASSLFGCGILAVLCGLHAVNAVDEKIAPVWAQKGYDATHHARSPFHGPHSSPRIAVEWTSPNGQPFSDYPVINTDGRVIAVDDAGTVFAVNFENGEPQIRYQVDSGDAGRPRGSPALVGGELIVPLPDGMIDVINSETGQSMGTIQVADASAGDTFDIVVPSLPGDIEVIVTSVGRVMYMFLWSRGTIPKQSQWAFDQPTGNINGIAIGQAQGKSPIAYATSSDGNLYAVQLLDGTPAWAQPYNIGKDITDMPAISRDGLFVFINEEGEGTFKIDSQTGELVWWRPDVDILGGASFVVGQNGNLLGGDRVGNFISFDAVSGNQTWAAPYKADDAITSPAVVDGGGYVYFSDRGGNIYCLDSVTGQEEWKLDSNATDLGGMAIDDDHALYAVTGNGMMIRIVGEQPPIIIPRTRIPSKAQWAQRGGTPQHSGESTFSGPVVTDGSQVGFAWTFKTAGEIVVGAVAAEDGTIIIPDDEGNVYGLVSSTGKEKWIYHVDTGFVAGEPGIDIGSKIVYIGYSTGLLLALNIADGTEVWHTNLPAGIHGSVTVTSDSRVYVSCDDDYVYGFDGQAGRQTFRVSTGSLEDDFAPAVLYDDSTILVGSADGFVRAYNSFTQGLRWRYQTHGAVVDVPCVAQTTGDIFIGAANELIAIDGNSGDRLWEQANVNIAGSSPGCGNKHNLVYVGGSDYTLYAVEQATGTERWSFATQDALRSNPVLDKEQETLYLTGMDGYLYALDAATGNLNWKIFVALFLEGDPVIMSDSSIIVTSEDSDMVYKIAIPAPAPAPGAAADAGVIVAVLLVVGVVGYAGGGIGYSYARTGEVRHVHGKFWSGVGASIGGWCQSTTQGMLRRPVPTGYNSSSAPIASSSSSGFQTSSASSGFPTAGAATSTTPAVGSGGGYGSL